MIGTIEEEYALCEKAFEGVEVGSVVRCLHHSVLVEALTEPIENRFTYILEHKEEHERAIRFHEMRPVPDLPGHKKLKKMLDEYRNAGDEYLEAQYKWHNAWDERRKARDEWRNARRKYFKAGDEFYNTLDKYITKHRAVIIALVPDTVWDGYELRF